MEQKLPRDEHLATDQASVTNVCLDYLENQLANGIEWKQMVVLYATAPLRTSEDIQNTLRPLKIRFGTLRLQQQNMLCRHTKH